MYMAESANRKNGAVWDLCADLADILGPELRLGDPHRKMYQSRKKWSPGTLSGCRCDKPALSASRPAPQVLEDGYEVALTRTRSP